MIYNVFGGTLNLAQPTNLILLKFGRLVHYGFVIKVEDDWWDVRPQVEM